MAPADSIVDRMINFFDRQLGLYGEMVNAYASLSTDLEAEDLDALTTREEAFASRTRQLEEELRILSREWQKTDSISDAEREHIAGLARHAEGMAKRLECMSQEAAIQAQARMRSVKNTLDGLRRGQQSMAKYRSNDGGSGYLDTKA